MISHTPLSDSGTPLKMNLRPNATKIGVFTLPRGRVTPVASARVSDRTTARQIPNTLAFRDSRSHTRPYHHPYALQWGAPKNECATRCDEDSGYSANV